MRRIRAVTAVMAVVGVVVLAGCSASGNDSNSAGDSAAAPRQSSGEAAGNAKPQAPAAGKSDSSGGGGKDEPTITRAIIKSGSLAVEGEDVSALRQKAVAAISGLGGQVAAEDTMSDPDGRINRSNLVLKVPTKSFETAIQRLSDLGKRLQIHQESTDVTEQVVDVASRIESQRASLDRTRALMTKANTIGEIVSVESELTKREADLASLQARKRSLANRVDLSTITVFLHSRETPPPGPVEPDSGFVAGLKGGWHAFVSSVKVVLTILGALTPFVIAIGVPVWLIVWWLRRRRDAGLRPLAVSATHGLPMPTAETPPVSQADE